MTDTPPQTPPNMKFNTTANTTTVGEFSINIIFLIKINELIFLIRYHE
jgi:hypothetical protein